MIVERRLRNRYQTRNATRTVDAPFRNLALTWAPSEGIIITQSARTRSGTTQSDSWNLFVVHGHHDRPPFRNWQSISLIVTVHLHHASASWLTCWCTYPGKLIWGTVNLAKLGPRRRGGLGKSLMTTYDPKNWLHVVWKDVVLVMTRTLWRSSIKIPRRLRFLAPNERLSSVAEKASSSQSILLGGCIASTEK